MATRRTFQGSPCKTSSCSGHIAGYRYARSGGTKPSPYSKSFNDGMGAVTGTYKKPTRKRARRN